MAGQTNSDIASVEKSTENSSKHDTEGSLFNRTMIDEAGKGLSGLPENSGLKSLSGPAGFAGIAGIDSSKLGLPDLDIQAFGQEAPYHSQGGLQDIWHGIKHAFVKDDSLDDRVRQHVEDQMTPAERKKFEAENKAIADYNHKVIEIESRASLLMEPLPPYPDTPMHKEIDRRTAAMEKSIADEVKKQMSPADRKRLDDQEKDYEHKIEEQWKRMTPYGTPLMPPAIEPGNAVKDYYDRIREATEHRLAGDASR